MAIYLTRGTSELIAKYLTIIFLLFSVSIANAEFYVDRDKNGNFTVHLEEVGLDEVKNLFKQNYGIIFKGESQVFKKSVSTSFSKLSLENSLKRLLTGINYVITYNSEGDAVEVRLLPPSESSQRPSPWTRRSSVSMKTSVAKNVPKKDLDHHSFLQDDVNSFNPQRVVVDSHAETKDDVNSFKPQRVTDVVNGSEESLADDVNSFIPQKKTPGLERNQQPDDITNFQIIPNAPPPN